MKVLVAGGSGAIGRFLVPALTARGHEVHVLSRSLEKLEVVKRDGARAYACDVFDQERVRQVVAEAQPEVIVDQLTQIPRQLNTRRVAQELAPTNRLRTEGTRNLMQAGLESGVGRFVAASIAFAYDPSRAKPATELEPLYVDAPGGFSLAVQAVVEHERSVLANPGVAGVILRYGYFYGPGSVYARDGSFTQGVLIRRLPIVGDGQGVFSYVHLQDAANATVQAIEGEMSGIYNIVDDEPVRIKEFLPWFASLLGAAPPQRIPRFIGLLVAGPYGVYMMTRQRGASNAMAKQNLGWELQYPSWRQGLSAEFGKA